MKLPERPNSDRNMRALVNLNGYVAGYSPPDVSLVTDFYVHTQQTGALAAHHQRVRYILKTWSRDPLVGRYLSLAHPEVECKRYPANGVRSEWVPKKWIRKNSNFVDISIPEAARAWADLTIAEAKHTDCPILFGDNVLHPGMAPKWVSWEDTCHFLGMVKEGVNEQGKLLVVNVAMAPYYATQNEINMLTPVVDGVCFETPFHPRARGNPDKTQRQINAYRTWLAAGKIVVWIAIDKTETPDKYAETRMMAGFAMMVRQPGDSLFLSWAFWRPAQDWFLWPEQMGKPLDDYVFVSDRKLLRRFEHGTMTVDTVARTVEIER